MAKRTCAQLVADVMRETRGQANLLECRQALKKAFEMIDARTNYEFLEQQALINYVAPYQTGTVTVSAGAVGLTGNGTTWGWNPPWPYREIKFAQRRLLYPITTFGGPASGTLAFPLSGSTNIVNGAYAIYNARFALPSDCAPGRDLKLRGPIGWGETGNGDLKKMTVAGIERRKIDEISTAGNPIYWTDAPVDDTTKGGTIRLWPAPKNEGEMRLTYYRHLPFPSNDGDTTILPEEFDELPVALASARLMRLRNQNGWNDRATEAADLMRQLHARHAASPAYANELEPEWPDEYEWVMFGLNSRLYTQETW